MIEVRRETLEPVTIGQMWVDRNFFGYTLERPWLGNVARISCIPAGTYKVIVAASRKFGRPMLRLENVPGRSGILIHNANRASELQGCIAVASGRKGNTLLGGLSESLRVAVEAEFRYGKPVSITIKDPGAP